MHRASIALMAFVLGTGAATVHPATRLLASAAPPQQNATLKPASATAPNIPFNDSDSQSEQQLLSLANESRKQAGAPPLTL